MGIIETNTGQVFEDSYPIKSMIHSIKSRISMGIVARPHCSTKPWNKYILQVFPDKAGDPGITT